MPSYKVIKSGHIVEIYEYQNTRAKLPIVVEDEYNGEIEEQEKEQETAGEEKGERTNEYKQRTNIRARNNIRRLINMNFNNESLFVTLTFADNIQDIPYANNEFDKFIKRMKRRQQDFAYVAVMEFQKRGAIHYHMVCNWHCSTWNNLEELHDRENEIAQIWKHGFCDIQEIKHLDNVGAYLIKYMTKDNIDERLNGKKRYFHSQNLDKPMELTGEEAKQIIEEYLNKIPVFTNEYSSEWTGKVMYREYNPLRWDKEK